MDENERRKDKNGRREVKGKDGHPSLGSMNHFYGNGGRNVQKRRQGV